ncbi:MAG: hypothetical protein C0614_01495 [Desulfuromonas sp.]|nr:MAG: hypothetical protein C0614_01495 [Desulfuromonas sp.]
MNKEQNSMTAQVGEYQEQQPASEGPRFPELQELQEEVQRRIRNNQKFLQNFMNEDFGDDEDELEEQEGQDPLDFEEL